jgi:uracil-DNA glycosylase
VPGFGDPDARVLVVGLAPAAHGANRTGRNFTGDGVGGSGDFLMAAMHASGWLRCRRPAASATGCD